MQIAAKTHYATLAMVELASSLSRDEPLAIRRIGERHNIPVPFLTQIFQQLRVAGLVISKRGAAGGYSLAKPAESIYVADIVDAMGVGALDISVSTPDRTNDAFSSTTTKTLQEFWIGVGQMIRERFEQVSLSELANECQHRGMMFYI